jgi:hypothetical protein
MQKLQKSDLTFVMKREIPEPERFDRWYKLRGDDIMAMGEIYGCHFTCNHSTMIPWPVYEFYYNDIESGEVITIKL